MFTGIGNVRAAEETKPKIEGKAAIVMDMDTGEIVYENNIDRKQYPASTTKLLTGLLFAESKTKTELIKYTESAKKQEPSSLDKNLAFGKIKVGDSIVAQDVMDALLIFSANDSANMIADSVSSDSSKFADLMNDRINRLGLKNTHFLIPSGLHHQDHYTTPYDLSVIGMEAFKNQWVRETLSKKSSIITTSSGITMIMDTRNKLLDIDGCLGGKTGYTSKAGRTLVAFFDRNGRKLVGVVMNSVYDAKDTVVFEDMKNIIEWSYNTKTVNRHKSGDTVTTEIVSYRPFRFFGPERKIEVPVLIKEDVKYFDNAVNKSEAKEIIEIAALDAWKLDGSSSVGTLTLNERRAAKKYNLYTTVSTKDIVKENLPLYIGAGAAMLIFLVVLLFTLLKIRSVKRRKSRKYYY
jgi:D-alanyl-D-alanine carboxypeptidase